MWFWVPQDAVAGLPVREGGAWLNITVSPPSLHRDVQNNSNLTAKRVLQGDGEKGQMGTGGPGGTLSPSSRNRRPERGAGDGRTAGMAFHTPPSPAQIPIPASLGVLSTGSCRSCAPRVLPGGCWQDFVSQIPNPAFILAFKTSWKMTAHKEAVRECMRFSSWTHCRPLLSCETPFHGDVPALQALWGPHGLCSGPSPQCSSSSWPCQPRTQSTWEPGSSSSLG